MITRRHLLLLILLGCVGIWLFLLWLERSYRQEENDSLIEDGLYMGGYVDGPPPGTGAVLNLCEIDDPYRANTHAWEPIRDTGPAPDLAWLRRMVEFVDARRRAGDTTYVHCRNGVSRSGMVVTAYFMQRNNWSCDQALAFVRSKRAITRPNPAFMERLLEWELVLKGQPTPGKADKASSQPPA
jgi:hypothetical protein